MTYILAVIGSVTTASVIERRLMKHGCTDVSVTHTPVAVKPGGCSYSVKVPGQYLDLLLSLAEKGEIKKLYRINEINGERSYHDISG